jgi:hypothetical protein
LASIYNQPVTEDRPLIFPDTSAHVILDELPRSFPQPPGRAGYPARRAGGARAGVLGHASAALLAGADRPPPASRRRAAGPSVRRSLKADRRGASQGMCRWRPTHEGVRRGACGRSRSCAVSWRTGACSCTRRPDPLGQSSAVSWPAGSRSLRRGRCARLALRRDRHAREGQRRRGERSATGIVAPKASVFLDLVRLSRHPRKRREADRILEDR